MTGKEQTFGEPIPITWGQVKFCFICPTPNNKAERRRAVLCTTYSGEGRCEEHRDVPDTELPAGS